MPSDFAKSAEVKDFVEWRSSRTQSWVHSPRNSGLPINSREQWSVKWRMTTFSRCSALTNSKCLVPSDRLFAVHKIEVTEEEDEHGHDFAGGHHLRSHHLNPNNRRRTGASTRSSNR
jgi:hypothetical protein